MLDRLHKRRDISIHALREEGDSATRQKASGPTLFLSTPSARRATIDASTAEKVKNISIHALREEGDITGNVDLNHAYKFLSTPSARRATSPSRIPVQNKMLFLSTPSARRATAECPIYYWYKEISIHALREEGDLYL